MRQVIGFEGIPDRPAPLTYGAAALREGDLLVNAVTGFRSEFNECLNRNRKSLVLLPSPYLLRGEVVKFVLEIRHPLLQLIFHPAGSIMHNHGLMGVPCEGFTTYHEAGLHVYFFESWEALNQVCYEMAACLRSTLEEGTPVLDAAARTLDERIVKQDTEDMLVDYGDRQERAKRLVATLRANPDMKPYKNVTTGRVYSPAELADEIENMTLVGKAIVAVAGLVGQATANDPELAARIREGKQE